MLEKIIISLFLQSILLLLCLPFLCFSQVTDTITSSSWLVDPNTIDSPGRVFQLGFFSPPNSTNRYLAVFYAFSNENVVWVANRDRPLNDSSGNVTIAPDGNLVLRNGVKKIIWSTNVTVNTSRPTSVHIQDTGNLLLRDTSTGNALWESFMHPINVFIPSMRVIHNTRTNEKVLVSSWRNPSDPAVGNFTCGLEVTNRLPQVIVRNNGRGYWRSGPWNGETFIDVLNAYAPIYSPNRVVNDSLGMFYYTILVPNCFVKVELNSSGGLIQTLWNNQTRNWDLMWSAPQNECEIYGRCGPFGSCNMDDSPICSCLRGFEPENRDEWDRGNWTSGCVRRKQLQCSRNNNTEGGNGDRFVRLPFTKLPDTPIPFASRHVEECRSRCLGNCSCIAYAFESNIGCMFWSETLTDIQRFANIGHDLYIRVEASELGYHPDRWLVIIIPVVVSFFVISVGIFIAWFWMRKGKKTKDTKVSEAGNTFLLDSSAIVLKNETDKINFDELPIFTFETLANATDHFSEINLLGKGGFGHVYKGILPNGKEIAVKRLSTASGQGNEEFMNEVAVISKVQHRNLVRLLGCCVEREEKMIIYEYMPNKSLVGCLFDPAHPSQKYLDWKTRFGVIDGIGRGLMYLHRDSRLKIIHRDLKPSNVLLDEDLTPKISDFGMARIFGGNEEHLSTARVVGTYGYMSPEYAIEGQFSEKSDVYSFGVLMLEILSGKKNTRYYNQEWSLGLLGWAWKLWNEDNALELVDQTTITSPDLNEDIVRCIHIALLCVQEFPIDRPAIQNVLSMLSRETVDLPTPKEPAFVENWNQDGSIHPRVKLDTLQITNSRSRSSMGDEPNFPCT